MIYYPIISKSGRQCSLAIVSTRIGAINALSTLVAAMLFVELAHRNSVDKNQRYKNANRTLLSHPKAERYPSQLKTVQWLYEQNAHPYRHHSPHDQ